MVPTKMKLKRWFAVNVPCLGLVWFVLSAASLNAEIQLGSLFQDHMVLQRDMPIPVWGSAEPGTKVTVKFADQVKTGEVDEGGKWRVDLSAMPASFESREMKVSGGLIHDQVVVADVLVGEVWICSGQSNMQMKVAGVPEVQALIPQAKNIRSFRVKNTVAFSEQDRCEGTWGDEPPDSAVALAFAYYLEELAEAPIGIILTAWGSSSLEAWMPRDMTATVPHFKTMMAEFDADLVTRDRIQAALDGPKPWANVEDIFLRRQPNILYNTMMKPLAPYACRGLVWYQGERNAQSMQGMLKDPWWSRNSGMLRYGDVLSQWMLRYRQEWEREDFQFLVVMLPGYGKTLESGPQTGAESPIAHSWAWIRDAQLQVLNLPHTAVANTIDLGDPTNVHPKDKLPVGDRLARLAARYTLDQKMVSEGPVLKKIERRDDAVMVHFENAEGLTTVDGEAPTAFWLADDAQVWVPAHARIEGQVVRLNSPEIEHPQYVRYAFAGKPQVNLVNGAGLPAYPFRTDSFEP